MTQIVWEFWINYAIAPVIYAAIFHPFELTIGLVGAFIVALITES